MIDTVPVVQGEIHYAETELLARSNHISVLIWALLSSGQVEFARQTSILFGHRCDCVTTG